MRRTNVATLMFSLMMSSCVSNSNQQNRNRVEHPISQLRDFDNIAFVISSRLLDRNEEMSEEGLLEAISENENPDDKQYLQDMIDIDLQHGAETAESANRYINFYLRYHGHKKALVPDLSDEEFVAILMYTGSAFKSLNKSLWKASIDEDGFVPYFCTLVSALNKIPSEEKILYRGTQLTTSKYDAMNYHKGTPILLQGITSTSDSEEESISFAIGAVAWIEEGADKRIHYIIKSSLSKNIQSISINPDEKEVVLLPGSFLVEEMTPKIRSEKEYLEVKLSELDKDFGSPPYDICN